MKKLIGMGLIVLALVLGYLGFNKVDNSGGSVEVVGVELSAEDTGKKNNGYIFLGLAVASLLAGVYTLGKSK